MPISPVIRIGRGISPTTAAALALVVGGLWWMSSGDAAGGGASRPDCDPTLDSSCESGDESFAPLPPRAPVLEASRACRSVGYLCAGLENRDRIRIERWRDFSGTLVVHIPLPDFEEPGVAIRLQNAAAAGVRAWNGQPFEIAVDERGDREAHFAVEWTSSLGGSQIGEARTQWSPQAGRRVLSLGLTTRSPFRPGTVIEPRQIRLTAAHEMGHALGLGHSDSDRDVMFPTNTAASLSARDYRTMEALYSLQDGTEIVR